MKPIIFEVSAPAYSRSDSTVIRISGHNHDNIKHIAHMTRQTVTAVADRLLEEALKSVQLVETPVYDMTMKE
jgi:hypothetical protein